MLVCAFLYVCKECLYLSMYVYIYVYSIYICMYYVYMSFPQMSHCNIAPLHQLGICHNNVTVDNTFPTLGYKINEIYVCMYRLPDLPAPRRANSPPERSLSHRKSLAHTARDSPRNRYRQRTLKVRFSLDVTVWYT